MILIVDDKPENLVSLRGFLEHNNFSVDSASSGEEALRKVLKTVYSLIILDVQMPGMDGFEVAETILDYSKAKDTPILFLSAVNIDKEFITRGYQSGAVDYITKPFDPDILLLKVKTFNRLFEQNNQLKKIQKSLKKEIEQRKLLEKKKDEFISIASHELKTPLTSMRGYIQLLERLIKKENNEDLKTYISKASFQINKLGDLVSDLLDISNMDSGKMKFNLRPFPFQDMLNNAIENIQHIFPEHTIIQKGSADLIYLGDEMRLEQVVINYLTNAIKYSPDKREIQVESIITEDALEIHVTDLGIGISQELQEQLFEKFFRVEESSNRFQGLGIGLYICREIIHRHNGVCGVNSQLGNGSTFYFKLPINSKN
ncbi:hybrid sensor histidine kinase/response regulator [Albibacterium sp.]|uniref:ATP-binding response regulator n=1 Tax=Albibacterium sp. TaxID=2952885 RepID=UPI002BF2372A|nr:hybrid sensor histidine kinase/response regulator [Albibacterium sp.]HUH17595.1 hybrid sensor histidine kinase/response regulator [Albibacterium sp.]